MQWISPAFGKQPNAGRNEEYIADFSLVSRQALDPPEYQFFRYHFLLGADVRLCCRYLHVSRGAFFRLIYQIEQKLGRAFRELKPNSLYPLDEYFCGAVRKSHRHDPRLQAILRRWKNRGDSQLKKIA